ncbi:MAG: CAAX prenyl protease-related protein [Candidatus Solibacter sp.]|nr:CAAX prenyl protease-related protein [Candidatus Solibacter sp.]
MLKSIDSRQRATLAYIAPFIAFVGIMAVERMIPLPPQWLYPVRFLIVAALIGAVSWPYLSFRPSAPLASIGIGVAVFVIWVAPDVLFGYRHHWLFENSLTGSAASTLAPHLKANIGFLVLRAVSSFALVPILEELFWRGWMMRWLIDNDFLTVPLGKYVPSAFWIVALLFASEHGPYWEVGLAAGIVYNWWMVRTRNLADCILAHAVTNAVLAAYVLVTGQWQYWL